MKHRETCLSLIPQGKTWSAIGVRPVNERIRLDQKTVYKIREGDPFAPPRFQLRGKPSTGSQFEF
jgi:hypothetical protein